MNINGELSCDDIATRAAFAKSCFSSRLIVSGHSLLLFSSFSTFDFVDLGVWATLSWSSSSLLRTGDKIYLDNLCTCTISETSLLGSATEKALAPKAKSRRMYDGTRCRFPFTSLQLISS
ncbi:hypothetical protein HC762_00430 [bacterium]|nr:hypothetical protein [bacterium]